MSNSNLESSKILAAIGALLLFLIFIPGVGGILGIVGLILVLIGLKGLAEYYRDDSIYRNAVSGVLFGIIGLIALAVGGFSIGLLGVLSVFTAGPAAIFGGFLLLLLLLVVVFVFLLFMALYFRKALYALADRSGEHLFHTAGTLLFIGAILIIVFFFGLIFVFIAWLIATIAFFSIRTPPQSYAYTPPPSPSTTSATRYCPNCGAPVAPDATYCSHCGKQLTQ